MNWNHLFLLANLTAATGWLILLIGVARHRRLTDVARVIGAILAGSYFILFVLNAEAASVLAANYSIRGIQLFFAHQELALLGWVHYLAFDLWIGAWEVDSATETMPQSLLIVVLLLTFALGPIGLCVFLAVRRVYRSGDDKQVPPSRMSA